MDCCSSCMSEASTNTEYPMNVQMETNLLSISLDLGQGPSPHFDDWSLRDASRVSAFVDVPVELRHGLMIQKCSYEAAMRLSKSAEGPYGICGGDACFEIIWQCEKLYDDLQMLQAQLSLTNWLEVQSARLHIQCLYLLYDEQTEARLAGVLRAYSTASEIITTVLSDDRSHDVLPFAPLRVTRIIYMSAVLLLRVLHSTSAAGLDYKHGRLLVNAAAFSLRQFSVLQTVKDQPVRVSEMLRAWWRVAERSPTMSSQDLNLRAKSRMGASLVYDCLIRFRDKTVTGPATNHGQTASALPFDFPHERLRNEAIGGSQTSVPSLPFPDPTIFPEDMLNVSPEIDIANMSWLEDIGYPGFADMEMW